MEKQLALEEQNKKNCLQLQQKLNNRQKYAKASFTTMQAKFASGRVEAIIFSSVKNQLLKAEYDGLKNNLQLQFIDLKIKLLKNNTF